MPSIPMPVEIKADNSLFIFPALCQARAMLNSTTTHGRKADSLPQTISSSWAHSPKSAWPEFLIKGKLSDRQIVHYALSGRYGPEVQQQFLARRRKPSAKKKDVNEGVFD